MKSATFFTAIACLASAAVASPVQAREEQAENGLFGGNGGKFGQNGANGILGHGDNLVSNIFDGAACIVSSVIGGGNPRCQGKGAAVAPPPAASSSSSSSNNNQSSGHYTYTYNTNSDGSLKITVKLENGESCTYDLKADGKEVKEVIGDAAQKCIAEHK